MSHTELTAPAHTATPAPTRHGEGQTRMARRGVKVAGSMMVSAVLGGCINIAAPDQPIVIELNINIRQEVIYRLAEDAANTIDENADIF